jgi:hypothetical protein
MLNISTPYHCAGAYHIWGIPPGTQIDPSLSSPKMGRTSPFLGAYHIWGIPPGTQIDPSLSSPKMGRTPPFLGAYHIWGIPPGTQIDPSLSSPKMGRTPHCARNEMHLYYSRLFHVDHDANGRSFAVCVNMRHSAAKLELNYRMSDYKNQQIL